MRGCSTWREVFVEVMLGLNWGITVFGDMVHQAGDGVEVVVGGCGQVLIMVGE